MRAKWTIICFVLVCLWAGPSWAASSTVAVSATILSQNTCRFKANSLSLNFGVLDPLSPVDVTRQATIDFSCTGKDNPIVFFISDDDGSFETGPGVNRMKHQSLDAYIPYTFAVNPGTASLPNPQTGPPPGGTVTVTATLLADDFRVSYAGTYADTVTMSINP